MKIDGANGIPGRRAGASAGMARCIIALVSCLVLVLSLIGCASSGGSGSAGSATSEDGGVIADHDISSKLVFDHDLELLYANQFAVSYYNDGYKLITISDGTRYLVVPEGKEAPSDLPADIVILQQPLDHIYLVASATMDMFVAVDGLDSIRMTGTKAEDWYVEEARDAMERGDIIYAGKYNAPDYELIIDNDCDLAIESTMINHNPEVRGQLEDDGIPVLIDQSSYEEEPLGRSEWVKLYGALINKDDEAAQAFDERMQILESVDTTNVEPKTVSFFYINSNGQVNVRKSSDYVPKMIEMAGGKYVYNDLGDEMTKSSNVKMDMEEFYDRSKDADYLIYNSTIEGPVNSLSDLESKAEVLSDFKAVKDGNVWCTQQSMYQDSMELASFIKDVNLILLDPNTPDEELTYLYRLT